MEIPNDAKVVENMEEDLIVMNRVIDRALENGFEEEAPPSKLGVRFALPPPADLQ